jgi:hypothetical protein
LRQFVEIGTAAGFRREIPKETPIYLGRIDERAHFLVEAKAPVSERISSSQATSATPKSFIEKGLNTTRSCFRLKKEIDLSHIPTSKDEFTGGLKLMDSFRRPNEHALPKFILDIFIDVAKLKREKRGEKSH